MTSVLKHKQQSNHSRNKNKLYVLQAIDQDQTLQRSLPLQTNFYYQDPITNHKLAINKNMLNLCPNPKTKRTHPTNISPKITGQMDNNNANKKDKHCLNDRKNVEFRHSCGSGQKNKQNTKAVRQCYQLLQSTRKFQISTIQARNLNLNLKIGKSTHKSIQKQNKLQAEEQQLYNLEKSKIQKCLKRRKQEEQGYSREKEKLAQLLTCNSTHENQKNMYCCQSIHTTPSSPRVLERNSQPFVGMSKLRSVSKARIQERFRKNRVITKNDKKDKDRDKDKEREKDKERGKDKQKDKDKQDNYNGDEEQNQYNNAKFLKKLVRRGGGLKSLKNIPFSIGRSRKVIMEITPVQRAIKETQIQLRNMIRKKGQYLIMPKVGNTVMVHQSPKFKQLGQIMISSSLPVRHCQHKSNPIQSYNPKKQQPGQTNKYFRKSLLDSYLFKLDTSRLQNPSPSPSSQTQPVPQSILQAYTKILQGIEHNNYHLVQIQLSLNPQILQIKQESNKNNLLHICIMHNREDIFEMIFRKCREYGIDAVTEKNKYGRTPFQLGNRIGFFRNKELKELLRKIEKEKIAKAYKWISLLL